MERASPSPTPTEISVTTVDSLAGAVPKRVGSPASSAASAPQHHSAIASLRDARARSPPPVLPPSVVDRGVLPSSSSPSAAAPESESDPTQNDDFDGLPFLGESRKGKQLFAMSWADMCVRVS